MSDEAINAAINLLRSQGYVITRPEWGPWTTSTELRRKFPHLSQGGFFKRLHSFPGDFPCEWTAKNSLRRFRTCPELLEWLGRPLEQGKRTDLTTA